MVDKKHCDKCDNVMGDRESFVIGKDNKRLTVDTAVFTVEGKHQDYCKDCKIKLMKRIIKASKDIGTSNQ